MDNIALPEIGFYDDAEDGQPDAAGDFLMVVISGLNDDTDQPAGFDLRIRAEFAAPGS